jgi:hypothetical protein
VYSPLLGRVAQRINSGVLRGDQRRLPTFQFKSPPSWWCGSPWWGQIPDALTGLARIHNRAWVTLSAPSQVRPLDGI